MIEPTNVGCETGGLRRRRRGLRLRRRGGGAAAGVLWPTPRQRREAGSANYYSSSPLMIEPTTDGRETGGHTSRRRHLSPTAFNESTLMNVWAMDWKKAIHLRRDLRRSSKLMIPWRDKSVVLTGGEIWISRGYRRVPRRTFIFFSPLST